MRFKTIAVITAIVALALGVAHLFFGAFAVGRWQIQPTDSVLLF